jgi:hypothetical protein
MFEAPTSNLTRKAINDAHQARSDTLIEIVRWFRKPFPSK